MNPIFQSFLTAALTLIGGSFLFVFTKILEHYLLKPLSELDEIRVKISENIVFHANTFKPSSWSKENIEAVQDELRLLASKLRAVQFKFERARFILFFFKISPKKIGDASSNLIGLSNTIGKSDFDKIDNYTDQLKDLLRIKI